jgi:hypothetical protein
MYDCTKLTQFNGLYTPQRMLACYSPSLQGKELHPFLTEMDQKEWKILLEEEEILNVKFEDLPTEFKVTKYALGALTFGPAGIFGMAASGNPAVGIATGIGTGAAVAIGFEKFAVNTTFEKVALQIYWNRSIRVTSKEIDIKRHVEAILKECHWRKPEEIYELEHAYSHFSLGDKI